jgi:deoxyribonuclease V
MDFYSYLCDLVKQIPSGKISTYTHLLQALGDTRARRAVKETLETFHKNISIPWYRVINDNGTIEKEKQKHLLQLEKIPVHKKAILKYKDLIFADFTTAYPLKKLRKKQLLLQRDLVLEDSFTTLECIGGAHLSYQGRTAYAAYVAMDYRAHTLDIIKTLQMKTNFPYISTYLTYQELPIIKNLMKNITPPSILLLNGHGISHPYHFGLASHLGVVLDTPTIGIAKTLLCGTISHKNVIHDFAPLIYKRKKVGWAHWPHGAQKPIFISPGHKISIATSIDITKKMCQYRIPEPLRKARLLTQKRKQN